MARNVGRPRAGGGSRGAGSPRDNLEPERHAASDERLAASTSGAGTGADTGARTTPTDDRRPTTAPSKRPRAPPAPPARPARRHIARTATSATLPRFSIARADTIDRSADNITYTPTSHGAPPFTRSNAVATIGVRPLAKMPDTW